MRINPDAPDPGVPDWKAQVREEARRLLALQEDNRVRRQKLLNDQAHAIILRPEIKNTSIGK